MKTSRLTRLIAAVAVCLTALAIGFVVPTQVGAATPKDARYVGAETCKMCHGDLYAFWTKSKHGQAFKLLESLGKEKDPGCVACHTTGFGKGGFEGLDKTANLTAVQCEACHGPGSVHAGGPSPQNISRKFGAEVCAACHMKVNIHPVD